jgi:hypothetical protein
MPSTSSRVFISYARADAGHLKEFLAYTADLKNNGVKFLFDCEIPPGDDFKATLSSYLDRADVVVLLLTQNFVKSEYCMTFELPRAIRNMEIRKCRVLPLNVEKFYATPGSALASMQWTPSGEPITERSPKSTKSAWIDAAWTLDRCIRALWGA